MMPGHLSACWLPDDVAGEVDRRIPVAAAGTAAGRRPPCGEKTARRSPAAAGTDRDRQALPGPQRSRWSPASTGSCTPWTASAWSIRDGETLGLVGETGCGKSTLARCIARLQPVTEGKIVFDGQDITDLSAGRPASDAPRRADGVPGPVRLAEPATPDRRHRGRAAGHPRPGARQQPAATGSRSSWPWSGSTRSTTTATRPSSPAASASVSASPGRWRSSPRLLICDEPVSALDVSVQAQVINLLQGPASAAEPDLRLHLARPGRGRARERPGRGHVRGQDRGTGPADALYREPRHPYAAALLSAASVTDPDLARQRRRMTIEGDIPSPIEPPHGLPVPPALPAGPGPVPGRGAGAGAVSVAIRATSPPVTSPSRPRLRQPAAAATSVQPPMAPRAGPPPTRPVLPRSPLPPRRTVLDGLPTLTATALPP